MTKQILEMRERAPQSIRGAEFDAWLLPLINASLAPLEYEVLGWLLLGEPGDEPISTNDLNALIGSTAHRVGSVLSRLRRLGLIETTYRTDEHGREAYHIAVAWVRAAYGWETQQIREAIRELIVMPPGRVRVREG